MPSDCASTVPPARHSSPKIARVPRMLRISVNRAVNLMFMVRGKWRHRPNARRKRSVLVTGWKQKKWHQPAARRKSIAAEGEFSSDDGGHRGAFKYSPIERRVARFAG